MGTGEISNGLNNDEAVLLQECSFFYCMMASPWCVALSEAIFSFRKSWGELRVVKWLEMRGLGVRTGNC